MRGAPGDRRPYRDNASGSKQIAVNATPSAAISVAPHVYHDTTGNWAVVADAGPGATYDWTIVGGAITGGWGTSNIQFATGAPGTVTLGVTVRNSSGCAASTTLDVTVEPCFEMYMAAPGAVCDHDDSMASAPSVPGQATYTWTISNGQILSGQGTTQIVFRNADLDPVTLGLTISDGASCTFSTSQQVTVIAGPSATITGPAAACPGSVGNHASVPDAGYGVTYYFWNITNGTITAGAGTRNITFTAGASGSVTLSVTVFASSGCGTGGTLTVPISAPSAAITAPAAVCAGSTGHAASVADAGTGATYAWTITNGTITGGAGTKDITFSAGETGPITLGVTVTSGAGCTAAGSQSVAINAAPSAAIAAPAAVCAGSTGHAASVADAGAGATYAWTITNGTITGGAGTKDITFSAGETGPITLGVTVTTGAGCTATGSKSVAIGPIPQAAISASAAACSGSSGNVASVADAGTGASYTWAVSNGTITAGTGTRSITFTAGSSGSVELGVTVQTALGCTATGAQGVAINPLPSAAITAPSPVCGSSTGNVASVGDAGTGASYAWSITNGAITSGAGTRSITFTAGPSGAVTVSVAVTSGSGCTATGSQTVTVNATPSAVIAVPAAVCPSTTNAASVADAGSGATYTWTITNGTITSGAGTRSIAFQAAASGTVTLGVTVRTAAGCSSAGAASVAITPIPSATITASSSACAGSGGNTASVADAGPGASYTWTVTNGSLTSGNGTPAITYTAGASGSVTLAVTVANATGCSASGSKSVTIRAIPSAVITAPTSVRHGATNKAASVPSAGTGATYAWTITNGTITSGQGTRSIKFTAGGVGTLTLGVTVTTQYGCTAYGTKVVPVT